MERIGDLVAADALDFVGSSRFDFLGAAEVRINGSFRVSGNDLDAGVFLFEIAAHPTQCAAGTGRRHEVCNLAFRLVPDFRTRGFIMCFGIGLVVKLIGEDSVGCIVSDRFRLHHIVVRMIGWDGRGCNDDLGTIGPEQPHFFV